MGGLPVSNPRTGTLRFACCRGWEPDGWSGVATLMSSISDHETAKRDPVDTLASLAGAALVGTAASIIHGAFDRIALDARRSPPALRSSETAEGGIADGQTAQADSPADVPPRGWWDIIKNTASEVSKDRVLSVAGGVTFYGLLSLFPAITVLVSVYGLFTDPQSITQHIQLLSSFLPESAMSIIGDQIRRITSSDPGQLSLALVFGLAVALWSANAAMKALMDSLNIAYGVEERRSFIRLTMVSLLFTLSAIIGLLVMFAVVALVPLVLQMFWLGSTVDFLIWAGRWPAAFLLVLLALAVLYQWGPNRSGVKVAMDHAGKHACSRAAAAAFDAVLMVRRELRQVQRNLWFARRRHRLHDVDVAFRHHRDGGSRTQFRDRAESGEGPQRR
jgi:membrane protein